MPIAKAALEAFEKNRWRQFHSNVWMARQDEADLNLSRVRAELRRSKNLQVQPYKKQYEMACALEVNALNAQLAATRGQLMNLLTDSLQFPAGIDIANLRVAVQYRPSASPELLDGIGPPVWADYAPHWIPPGLAHLSFVRRLQSLLNNPLDRYERALIDWQAAEQARKELLREEQQRNDAILAIEADRVDRDNRELDEYRRQLAKGDRDTVVDYFDAALNSLLWPRGFPKRHRIDYQQVKTNLDVWFAYPTIDIVPEVKSYALDTERAKAVPTPMTEDERKELYHSVITQATLRLIRELFGSNAFNLISTISLTGRAEGYGDANGQGAEQHLARFTVDIRDFDPADLTRAQPEACLRALAAAR